MKYVLCYGDSNTWGCKPEDHERYEFYERWPGIVQKDLGDEFRIYENGLNGRTTVFEDPIEEGRCGKEGFLYLLESCSPLDAVVIMLGTNDCKLRFGMPAWDIGWGMDLLLQYVGKANCHTTVSYTHLDVYKRQVSYLVVPIIFSDITMVK